MPPRRRREMKVTLLGTGTPTPSLKRASSGYLIEVGSDHRLAAPEPLKRILRACEN